MNPFVPEFQGELELDAVPNDFTARIRRRVETGLFVPGSRSRANYEVRSETSDAIDFAARGILTNYNVGLNDVHVERVGSRAIHYHVRFWRWTGILVAHGAILGAAFALAVALWPKMRDQFAAKPQSAWIFWSFVGFFCVLWPWILTAIHRKAAEHAIRRILADTLDPSAQRAA